MQHSRSAGRPNHAGAHQAPKRQPRGAVDHLHRHGVALTAQPLGFGGEGVGPEVEHRQHAHLAVRPGPGFQTQDPLAQAVAQLRGHGLLGRDDARPERFDAVQHGAHALDQRAAAGGHPQSADIAMAVQHAVGEGLLGVQQVQDRMLDGVFSDQIDHAHRAALIFAPGASDALLQLGGIPGQV